jgi:hypothetical protein
MELNFSNPQIYANVFINNIYIKFGGRFATYTLNNEYNSLCSTCKYTWNVICNQT